MAVRMREEPLATCTCSCVLQANSINTHTQPQATLSLQINTQRLTKLTQLKALRDEIQHKQYKSAYAVHEH